jgi:pyruvate,water dikinase
MVRRLLLAQAGILAARGDIDKADDVFYLTEDEAFRGLNVERSGVSLREAVAARRAAAARWEGLTPPERILWKGDLGAAETAVMDGLRLDSNRNAVPHEETAGFIQGIGCSPGKVRATALVVTDPHAVTDTSGKILIARSTDPGWVFLLLQAAGLVVEKGSPLSHTAIIGRELGIPTIVGAMDATRRIRTGDIVEMECGSGRVFLRGLDTERSGQGDRP